MSGKPSANVPKLPPGKGERYAERVRGRHAIAERAAKRQRPRYRLSRITLRPCEPS